jgi:hypothetical protein
MNHEGRFAPDTKITKELKGLRDLHLKTISDGAFAYGA